MEYTKFFDTFFGAGNALRWPDYQDGTMNATARSGLAPWIERVKERAFPVLLPRKHENGVTEWYAVAQTAEQFRALTEDLTAAIGCSYSDFDGIPAVLVSDDPIDESIASLSPKYVHRFRVSNKKQCWDAFKRLLVLWNRKDSHRATLTKPKGRLLRDFDYALSAKNETHAQEILHELADGGHLDASNKQFLEVQLLFATQRYSELLREEYIPDIVNLSVRPKRVTKGLIDAIYRVHVQPFEEIGDLEGAFQEFERLQLKYGGLFKSRIGLTGDRIVKSFALRYALSEPPEESQLRSVIEESRHDPQSLVWLNGILDAVAHHGSEDSTATEKLVSANKAFDQENYDIALNYYMECDPTTTQLEKIVHCAHEINAIEITVDVLDYLDEVSDELREALNRKRSTRTIVEAMQREVNEWGGEQAVIDLPRGWKAWLAKLNSEETWDASFEYANDHASGWELDDSNTSPSDIKEIATHIEELPNSAVEVFDRLLPRFGEALLPDGEVQSVFAEIYAAIATHMVTKSHLGVDELAIFGSFVEAILFCNKMPKDDAAEIVEMAWSNFNSVEQLDWLIDMFDVFIRHNLKSANLDRLFQGMLDTLRKGHRFVKESQWPLIEFVCKDLGVEGALKGIRQEKKDTTVGEVIPDRKSLAKKTIAIYTLTEKIGHRAAEMIRSTFDEVKIELCFDKVGTDRLRHLSTSADVLIMNKYDAKHSATEDIKKYRTREKVTLVPRSKSAGSLFRAVYQFALV